jgi:hypothetical protein
MKLPTAAISLVCLSTLLSQGLAGVLTEVGIFSNLGKYFGTTITKRVLQKKTFLKVISQKKKKLWKFFLPK